MSSVSVLRKVLIHQLLNRQVAAVNFAPLKPLFLTCYSAAHVHVQANPSLPPLAFNVRRNPETNEMREVLPIASFSLVSVLFHMFRAHNQAS